MPQGRLKIPNAATKTWHSQIKKILKKKKKNSLPMRLYSVIRKWTWTSLVEQWRRIWLLMQGTWVQSLVQEDSTCQGATKSIHHKHWARMLQLLKPLQLEPVFHSKRGHYNKKPGQCMKTRPHPPQLEKAHTQQWRPGITKNKTSQNV